MNIIPSIKSTLWLLLKIELCLTVWMFCMDYAWGWTLFRFPSLLPLLIIGSFALPCAMILLIVMRHFAKMFNYVSTVPMEDSSTLRRKALIFGVHFTLIWTIIATVVNNILDCSQHNLFVAILCLPGSLLTIWQGFGAVAVIMFVIPQCLLWAGSWYCLRRIFPGPALVLYRFLGGDIWRFLSGK